MNENLMELITTYGHQVADTLKYFELMWVEFPNFSTSGTTVCYWNRMFAKNTGAYGHGKLMVDDDVAEYCMQFSSSSTIWSPTKVVAPDMLSMVCRTRTENYNRMILKYCGRLPNNTEEDAQDLTCAIFHCNSGDMKIRTYLVNDKRGGSGRSIEQSSQNSDNVIACMVPFLLYAFNDEHVKRKMWEMIDERLGVPRDYASDPDTLTNYMKSRMQYLIKFNKKKVKNICEIYIDIILDLDAYIPY
jgi:hypothetical protein